MEGRFVLCLCPSPGCNWRTPVALGLCLGGRLTCRCGVGHTWYAQSAAVARALVGAAA